MLHIDSDVRIRLPEIPEEPNPGGSHTKYSLRVSWRT